jgi:hypothetical protein
MIEWNPGGKVLAVERLLVLIRYGRLAKRICVLG